MYRIRKLTAVLCALCLIAACLTGCAQTTATSATHVSNLSSEAIETKQDIILASSETSETEYNPMNTGIITGMSLDENGNFQIIREPAKAEPMGEKNTWTIFVYMCGSDLESDGGLASNDLQEMIDGSVNSRVRYVVMTGGALEWQNEVVDGSRLELYLIENGEIAYLDSADYHYMNDPETLYAFLSWGIENYPAAKMGLIFWNHGGGSIDGVCVDERFIADVNSGALGDVPGLGYTLSLHDISRVLSQVSEQMTDKFEFVGYDACLMGTLENAFMLSPYARYMYASEEVEPGCGWEYTSIGRAINRSGRIDGAGLGKVVCDGYFKGCAEIECEDAATLSCIDLSVIDDVIYSFDALGRKMMTLAEDPASLAEIAKNTNTVEFFGGNSETEGYCNLADLDGIVNAVSCVVPDVKTVLNAIGRAVTYNVNGILHENACGLSLYYPLHAETGTGELGRFAEVVTSPYYYGFVAQNFYAAANGGLNGYDPAESLNAWASAVDDSIDNIVEEYGEAHLTGQSPYISFAEEPQLYESGSFGFVLAEESIPYVSSVEAELYFFSDDGKDMVWLGGTTDVFADWETGSFVDDFDGLWFCTPDGQLISATVVSETEAFSTYTTPVLLNGEATNLRFVVDNSDFSVTLYGVWESVDEHGMAGRNSYQLTEGDVIQPLFHAFDVETQEEKIYFGEEYVYDGNDEWLYGVLFDDDYFYRFCIYDIYGDFYVTDGVMFNVKDGQPFFYPEG